MSNKPLSIGAEWDFDLLQKYDHEISRIANDFKLDTYPNQIEVISSEQMINLYSSVGMPIGYNHWSFGKQFVTVEKNYKLGNMGLAYELVINSNPCISYLMEENTLATQALVIAHACYGHNSFFKNNYLFKMWTNADLIIDYLVFAKNYIAECEERYGVDKVEAIIDACHALMSHGVDRYKHPAQLSLQEEKLKQQNREHYLQTQVNDLWRTLPETTKEITQSKRKKFPEDPQENILYFLEKNAPLLKSWQREIIRITRKISQYFYPQKQTKIMNEGWACFWHYTLLNALYDERLITDELMIEILQNHTNIIYQPPFDNPLFNGINPYSLGYTMMDDIKRICQNPTEEDKEWFPHLVNTNWQSSLDYAMRNFKDESFIAQYLSPHLMRELKLFNVLDDTKEDSLLISAIHNDHGYQKIREQLSRQYNISYNEPDIQVYDVDIKGDRSLNLRHFQHNQQPLKEDTLAVLKHLYTLWGFPVSLDSVALDGTITNHYQYPLPIQEK